MTSRILMRSDWKRDGRATLTSGRPSGVIARSDASAPRSTFASRFAALAPAPGPGPGPECDTRRPSRGLLRKSPKRRGALREG
jgi:hypothetical protein